MANASSTAITSMAVTSVLPRSSFRRRVSMSVSP
jgi:hypothetical protein